MKLKNLVFIIIYGQMIFLLYLQPAKLEEQVETRF